LKAHSLCCDVLSDSVLTGVCDEQTAADTVYTSSSHRGKHSEFIHSFQI